MQKKKSIINSRENKRSYSKGNVMLSWGSLTNVYLVKIIRSLNTDLTTSVMWLQGEEVQEKARADLVLGGAPPWFADGCLLLRFPRGWDRQGELF